MSVIFETVPPLGQAPIMMSKMERFESRLTAEARQEVGSGDSTVAGLAIALAKGQDVIEGLRLGTAAGAVTAMTQGRHSARSPRSMRFCRRCLSRN